MAAERDVQNIKDTSTYVASIFRYGDTFSVVPRNDIVNNDGVYLDKDAMEVYTIFKGKYSKIDIKQEGLAKVIKNALYAEGDEFFTAVLCMFHPKYANIDQEDNALDIVLENNHFFSKTGPKAIYVKTSPKINLPIKKKVALEDWLQIPHSVL